MKRSSDRILTTHVGSLPELAPISRDDPAYEGKLRQAVATVVRKQQEIGLDVINEGEFTKGGDWLGYLEDRFSGFEPRPWAGRPLIEQGKDREEFADFYRDAAARGTLFYLPPGAGGRPRRTNFACTGPITYTATAATRREIDLLREAAPDSEAFLTATAPASVEVYRRNEFYNSDEEYVFAIADAMRTEYELIAGSGLLLQVDDAWLAALWDRIGIAMGLKAFRKYCAVRVEALNHALANIPETQVRYHLCWGSWHGPHAYDLPLTDLIDIVLRVKAGAYLFEAANVRHEHEYSVWRDVKLREGQILVPGVVTHSTDVVEHPELVSQRIQRFAAIVGKENVIAGADCGFGWRIHPQIAWAKLRSLVDGARLATRALGYR